MKKEIKLIIAIIVIMILAIVLYLSPYAYNSEQKKNERVDKNAQIFTSKTLSIFNENKDEKASVAAKNAMKELNKINKNPYNKKLDAYTLQNAAAGQFLVEFDDTIQTITITSYDLNKKIIVRTLIKPPSFVTYKKEEQKNGK